MRAGLDVECHRRFRASVANLPEPQQTLRSANNDRHRVVAVIEIAETLLKERVALWESAGMPADYIVAEDTSFTYTFGQTYRMRLEAVGGNITCTVDVDGNGIGVGADLVLNYVDPAPLPPGVDAPPAALPPAAPVSAEWAASVVPSPIQ